jgi:hypothetical protein
MILVDEPICLKGVPEHQSPLKTIKAYDEPGTRAADIMRAKAAAMAASAARLMRWVLGGGIALVMLAMVAIGYYGWSNQITGRFSDDRLCSSEIGGYKVTGKRTYSYPYMEIYGFRFIDTKKIDERTVVDIRGDAVLILGQSADMWWSVAVGAGEQGIQILKEANQYTFVSGKKALIVSSKEFCK